MKVIVLNQLYQLFRICRISRISGLLQAISPGLIVSHLIIEKELVPVAVTKEIGMIMIGFLRVVVLSEALPLPVIIMIDASAGPVVVTLYSEVVVALQCQFGASVP